MSDPFRCRHVVINLEIENASVLHKFYDGTVIFKWPLTSIEWLLLIHLSDSKSFIKLGKLDEPSVVFLNGEVSVLINKENEHILEQFDFRFDKQIMKIVDLSGMKNIPLLLKNVISNNCLKLRIRLRCSSSLNSLPVQFDFRTKSVEQRCAFDWTIKSCTDSNGKFCFTEYFKDILRQFKNFMNSYTFRLSISLHLINFQEQQSKIKLLVTKSQGNAAKFFLRCKINVVDGQDLIPLELDWTLWDGKEISQYFDCAKTKKIESICSLSGKLILRCEFYVISPCPVAVDSDSISTNPVLFYASNYISGQNRSDIALRAGGDIYPCHKKVLCSKSPVFMAMFENETIEKESGVVDIMDIDSHLLSLFLSTLYSGKLEDENWQYIIELYAVADKYVVPDMVKMCKEYLIKNVLLENVCIIMKLADDYQDKELLDVTELFFMDYTKEIVRSDLWLELMESNIKLAANLMRSALLRDEED